MTLVVIGIGLIGIEISMLPKMIISFALMIVFWLILVKVLLKKQKSEVMPVGGMDIQISSASAFILGFANALTSLGVALLLVLIQMLITKKKDKDKKIAFLPYLCISIYAHYMLCVFL